MSREYDHYIPEVRSLNLADSFEDQRNKAASILGTWVLQKPSAKRADSAYNYMHGFLKTDVEKTFSLVLRRLTQRVQMDLQNKVEQADPDGGPGIVEFEVGFSETGKRWKERKLRTLKGGTKEKMEKGSPFKAALYQPGNDYLKELRFRDGLSWKLRTGPDELPQLGELRLLSIRGYLANFELRSLKILGAICGAKELGFSDEIIEIVRSHESIMLDQDVEPGIINPLSSIPPNGPPALARLYLDNQYVRWASASIDMRIGVAAVARRSRQLASVMVAIQRNRYDRPKQDQI